MKKIIMMLSLVLVLVGCSSGSSGSLDKAEAEALLKASLENVTMVNADVKLVVTSEESDYTIEMNLRNANDSKLLSAFFLMDAEELKMKYYVNEGFMYIDAFGMKIKNEVTADDLEEIIDMELMVDDYSDIEDFDFDRFTYTKSGDNIVYKYEITNEDAEKLGIGLGVMEYTINQKDKSLVKINFNIEDETVGKMVGSFDLNAKSKIEFPDFTEYISFGE